MDTIIFKHVIPKAFASSQELNSHVLKNDIVFEKGKSYLIQAESGKGKSTFCSYLIGYRNDFTGDILFDQTNVNSFNTKQWSNIRTHHISYLFQELRLFPELTAIENVIIKNRLTNYKQTQDIIKYFDIMGIAEKKDVPIRKMSFGQQQRVAIIRALCQPFDFILLDEPISHLDDHNATKIAHILTHEAKTQGAAIIVTSIGKHPPINYDQNVLL